MAATDEVGSNPGAHLRGVREQRGLSLHQVAVELHVSDFIIEALERGDYAVLGGAVFVRGHLRNYARALGISENEVLSLYDQAQDRPTAPNLVTQHNTGMTPRARDWYMRAATGGVVLVLLVLAVSWWQRRPEERAEPVQEQVEAAPLPATATSAVALVPSGAAQPVPQQSAANLSTPLAPSPVKPAVSRPQREEHKPANVPAQTPAAAAPAPTRQVVTGSGDAASLTHVQFSLSSASWIEVYDASGKRLYYDLAPAGNTLDLNGTGPLQVFLGNAPGVSVELNGSTFDIKPYSRSDNTARFKLGTPGGTEN
jgi:cytoskeleton protein RodZ